MAGQASGQAAKGPERQRRRVVCGADLIPRFRGLLSPRPRSCCCRAISEVGSSPSVMVAPAPPVLRPWAMAGVDGGRCTVSSPPGLRACSNDPPRDLGCSTVDSRPHLPRTAGLYIPHRHRPLAHRHLQRPQGRSKKWATRQERSGPQGRSGRYPGRAPRAPRGEPGRPPRAPSPPPFAHTAHGHRVGHR